MIVQKFLFGNFIFCISEEIIFTVFKIIIIFFTIFGEGDLLDFPLLEALSAVCNGGDSGCREETKLKLQYSSSGC